MKEKSITEFTTETMGSCEIVTDILKEIGVNPSRKGFSYLRYGILLAYEKYDLTQNICADLYSEIATFFGAKDNTTLKCMDNALKGAIHPEVIREYIGNTYVEKPTVSQFIVGIADRMLIQHGVLPRFINKPDLGLN